MSAPDADPDGEAAGLPAERPRPEAARVDRIEAITPTPGEHWRIREDGWLALVEDVHLVDGEVHAVTVRHAPRPGAQPRSAHSEKMHFDEFLRAHVHLEDQSEVWQRLDAAARAAAEAQQAAVAAIEARASRPLPLPGPGAAADERRAASRAILATEPEVTALAEALEARTKALTDALSAHADHREAHAQALMVGPQRTVGRIREALFKFEAYMGRDVEVVQVRDGEPAAAEGPVHMYQAVRFMDEEYIAHLAHGGADIADWPDFIDRLCADDATLDRIIPAPVGLCLMQWRREDKYGHTPHRELGEDLADQIGALLADIERNRANRERWFLYRDGGRAWAIFAPSVAHQGLRLWPTGEDLREAQTRYVRFLGRDERVTPDHVDWDRSVKGVRRFEGSYRAIMLTLAGVQDREALFRASGTSNMWLDADAAPAALKWVADDEALLEDDALESLDGALSRLTAQRIAPGARLLCNWHAVAACEELVPRERYKALRGQWWDVAEQFGHATVRLSHGRPYVEMPMVRARREGPGFQSQQAKVFLDGLGGDGLRWGNAGMPLCAPRVDDLPEIERHLLSRRSRVHYLRYYASFERLRGVLREVRANQADARAVVLAAARAEGVEDPAALWADAAYAWQRGVFDAPMPRSGEDGFDAACASLLGTLGALAEGRAAPEALIDAAAGPAGGAPCALAALANGQLAAYRRPAPQPARATEPEAVERSVLRRTATGWRRVGGPSPAPGGLLSPGAGGEALLWRDPGVPSPRWVDATPDMLAVSPGMWERLDRWMADERGAALLRGEWEGEELLEAMADAVRLVGRQWRWKGRAPEVDLLVPMGCVRGRAPDGSTAVRVGFAAVDLLAYGYHERLPEGLRGRFLEHWDRVYERPKAPREHLLMARFHLCSAHALASRLPKDLITLPYAMGRHFAFADSPLLRTVGSWGRHDFNRSGAGTVRLSADARGEGLLWEWLTAHRGYWQSFPHAGGGYVVRDRNSRWLDQAAWDRGSLLCAPGWPAVEAAFVPPPLEPDEPDAGPKRPPAAGGMSP